MTLSLVGCSKANTVKEYYDSFFGGNVVEEYNEQELLVKHSFYTEEGFYESFVTYEYDGDGNMTRRTTYAYVMFRNDNGEQIQIEERDVPPICQDEKFYANGQTLSRCAYGYTEEPYILVEYDENGTEIKRTVYDVMDGELETYTVADLGEDGTCLGYSTYDSEGTLIERIERVYDENGEHIGNRTYDGNGQLISDTEF